MKKGIFIVIDGIDSCGKGELVKRLAGYIFDFDKKHHVFLTREPYISNYTDEIRKLLLQTADPKENGELFAKLFVNDRKVHSTWILKELQAGHFIISDRFKYSTIAYEGAQGVPMEKIIKMHEGILIPNLTIIVDVPVKVAIKRGGKDKKRKFNEVFEREKHKVFQEKIRANYLKLPKIFPKERIVFINGNQSKEKVFKDASREIEKLLK